jgi:hypothetical protein
MSVISTGTDPAVTECCKVIVSGSVVKTYSVQGPVQLSKIHELAGAQGIKEYTAHGGQPIKELAESDFPFAGDIVVREHNEAKLMELILHVVHMLG